MNLPFSLGTVPLPDWLPWWLPAALAIPLGLYLLMALLMPFGTFGVKSRLEDIETQLEELRGDVRELLQRSAANEDGRRELAPRVEAEPRGRASDGRLERRPIGLRAEPRLGPR